MKGSLTVESAIVLPLFLCIIISIIFFIKAVHTHEVVQYALDRTANEMALFSYASHAFGIMEIDDSIEAGIDETAGKLADGMLRALGAMDALEGITNGVQEIFASPAGQLKDFAAAVAKKVYGDAKTQALIPIIKMYMKQYLLMDSERNIDERLKGLSVAGGYDGMDLSGSAFFEDEDGSIDLVVKYELNIALPIKILPEIIIVQRASSRAWLGGDGRDEIRTEVEDVWSLDNFRRGRRLRAFYGGNLPFNFPVIAAFDSGTATMIKSIDLTAKTYQTASKVADVINGYIAELAAFKGQEQPWGSKGIVIREAEINMRRLLLVIPGNPISPETEAVLESLRQKAAAKGIVLWIERYGFKKTADGQDESPRIGENGLPTK